MVAILFLYMSPFVTSLYRVLAYSVIHTWHCTSHYNTHAPFKNKVSVLSLSLYVHPNWMVTCKQEDDQPCQGSSPSLDLDAVFEQFVELSQNPSPSNLNCLDKVARYAVNLYLYCGYSYFIHRLVFKSCQYDPLQGVKFFREVLCKYHRDWIITKRNPKYPPFSEVSMDVPSWSDHELCPLLQLLVFKLINFIFPSTDLEHPVVTPAMLLMVNLLGQVL